MMIVDFGCGGTKRGDVGVDIKAPPASHADVVCNLGFEDVPLEDNSFDEVIMHHFIEHVPMAVWFRNQDGQVERLLPVIRVFNEAYRILKHNGLVTVDVPLYPSRAVWQDPTHVSCWTTESVRYFSGDYYGFHEIYGHTSRFVFDEKMGLELKAGGGIMKFQLRARKDLLPDAPYELHYKDLSPDETQELPLSM